MEASILGLANLVRFDAVFAGRGHRDNGQVIIEQVIWLQGLPQEFVTEYAAVAQHDRVAQLFMDFPWEPQAITVADYFVEPGSAPRRRTAMQRSNEIVGEFFQRFGIRHAALSGVENSYGLAWMGFHRIQIDEPFSFDDTENIKFELPAHLYRWQKKHLQRLPKQTSRVSLTPLTRREMEVCVRNVRGEAPKAIARDLELSVHYVRELIQRARGKLGVAGRKLTESDLMQLPPGN